MLKTVQTDYLPRLNPDPQFEFIRDEKIDSILMVRLSAMGDVLHALPSLAALKQLFPAAKISWLIEPLGAQLLEGQPDLDEIIVFDRKKYKGNFMTSPRKWWPAGRDFGVMVSSLRSQTFDLALDFQGLFRSGLPPFFSGAPHRISFHPSDCRELGGWLFANRRARPAPIEGSKIFRNLHLVRELGWEGTIPTPKVCIPDEDLEWAEEILNELPGKGPIVIVHPAVSSFGIIKQWPLSHYRDLLQSLVDEVDARVMISWGPGEKEMAEEIGVGTIAPPTMRLLKLAALIAKCDLLVAADTGCLHLGANLQVPLLGLYGPKSPIYYGPYPLTGEVVASEVPCSPCKLRRCEHRICMPSILPQTAFKAASRVLAETSNSTNSN